MNIYEDYANYINDNKDFLNKLIETNSSIYYVLTDVLKVCDYIYKKEQNQELEEELEEIFEIGFGFVSSVLFNLNAYYEKYFDKNIDVFNYYSELMLYFVYTEDLMAYLEVEEILTDDTREILDNILDTIDDILINKKTYSNIDTSKYDQIIDNIRSLNEEYNPVYNVFRLIVEELQLADEISQEEQNTF